MFRGFDDQQDQAAHTHTKLLGIDFTRMVVVLRGSPAASPDDERPRVHTI